MCYPLTRDNKGSENDDLENNQLKHVKENQNDQLLLILQLLGP